MGHKNGHNQLGSQGVPSGGNKRDYFTYDFVVRFLRLEMYVA